MPLIGGGAVPGSARDDVQSIKDVIDQVVKNYCVDPRRVFVTGFSGGARMSSALGCRLADRITAVAPVAGVRAGRAAAPGFSEPDASDCRPARALSVLAIHGTSDASNPFPEAKAFAGDTRSNARPSAEASLDRCSTSPTPETISARVTRLNTAHAERTAKCSSTRSTHPPVKAAVTSGRSHRTWPPPISCWISSRATEGAFAVFESHSARHPAREEP